jgi:hypothetical protein
MAKIGTVRVLLLSVYDGCYLCLGFFHDCGMIECYAPFQSFIISLCLSLDRFRGRSTEEDRLLCHSSSVRPAIRGASFRRGAVLQGHLHRRGHRTLGCFQIHSLRVNGNTNMNRRSTSQPPILASNFEPINKR